MAYIGRHGWNTLRVGGAIPDDALREAVDTSYEPGRRRAAEVSPPQRLSAPRHEAHRNLSVELTPVTLAILPTATESLDLDPWVWWVTIGVLPPSSPSTSCGSPATRTVPSNRETGLAWRLRRRGHRLRARACGTSRGPSSPASSIAGWLTEYSLSVDNLFIFILIMAKFAVPEKLQQSALMVGIVIAIVLRGLFIWLGAAAIEQFSWVFYIFGAFLLYTAWKLISEGESDDDEYEENRFMKFVESPVPRHQGVRRHQAVQRSRTASGWRPRCSS